MMFEVAEAWEVSKVVVSGKLWEKNSLNLPFMFFPASIYISMGKLFEF